MEFISTITIVFRYTDNIEASEMCLNINNTEIMIGNITTEIINKIIMLTKCISNAVRHVWFSLYLECPEVVKKQQIQYFQNQIWKN